MPAAVVTTPPTAIVTEGPVGLAPVPVPGRRFRWPLRPFDRAHPVRATFGEPRAILNGGDRGEWSPVGAVGRRVLHTGIDITARDGTPVYAVQSGVAIRLGKGDGDAVEVGDFGYWHLDDPVPSGTRVTAFRTVLGTVQRGQGHVHLTRFQGVLPVNPLTVGGITPYEDHRAPLLLGLNAYAPDGSSVPLTRVRGPVTLAVRAEDVQDTGRRTGVYGLSYRVAPPGDTATPMTEVVRFDTLPTLPEANDVYTTRSARHTFSTRFWYRLTIRPVGDGTWHAERVAPGPWEVTVRAVDVRGNATERTFPITVVR